MAFIPNPYNKPEINHIDGNKHNNAVSNLEWCTRKENVQHALKTSLIKSGSDSPMCKISKKKIRNICELLETNKYQIWEISEILNVNRQTVSNIKNKKLFTDISKNYNISNYNLKSLKHNKEKYFNRNHFSTYNEDTLKTICIYLSEKNKTMKEISNLTGVSVPCINNIKHRRLKSLAYKDILDKYLLI